MIRRIAPKRVVTSRCGRLSEPVDQHRSLGSCVTNGRWRSSRGCTLDDWHRPSTGTVHVHGAVKLDWDDHVRLHGRPTDVLMFTAEDGLAEDRPATGGRRQRRPGPHPRRHRDLRRRGRKVEDRWPDLAHDLDTLEAAIRATGDLLLIVDVLMAYLGADVNTYRDQDVRRVLSPLPTMAERTGCAIVCLRHPTKASNPNPILCRCRPSRPPRRVGSRRRHRGSEPAPAPAGGRQCNIAPKAPTMAYRLTLTPGDLVAHVDWMARPTIGPTS